MFFPDDEDTIEVTTSGTQNWSLGTSSLAFDPLNGYIYGTDGAGHVGIINTSSALYPSSNVTNSSSFPDPDALIYDPADGMIYVLNDASPIVDVINNTTLQASLNLSGLRYGSEIYDSADGDVYVAYLKSNPATQITLVVINGTHIVGNITIAGTFCLGTNPTLTFASDSALIYIFICATNQTGHQLFSFMTVTGSLVSGSINGSFVNLSRFYGPTTSDYDPANGDLYLAYGLGVAVLNGTQVVANILDPGPAGQDLEDAFPSYFPLSGDELLSDYFGLAVISTRLWESPITFSPVGYPTNSMYDGETSALNTSMWGEGTGNDSLSMAASPNGVVQCSGAIYVEVQVACTALETGNVTIWLNVSDGIGVVSSWIMLQVFSDIVISALQAYAGGEFGRTAADENESVAFYPFLPADLGPNLTYIWSGLGGGNCTGLLTVRPVCTFYSTGVLNISLTASDPDGSIGTSPPFYFEVQPRLINGPPALSRTIVDTNETVEVMPEPSGGSGLYLSTVVEGDPGTSCASRGNLARYCTFSYPGRFEVFTVVTDTNGEPVASPAVGLTVEPQPVLNATGADRTDLDVGQIVTFWANASQGFRLGAYVWTDLPGQCSGNSTNSPTCLATEAGLFNVSAVATDGNGGTSYPSASLTVQVWPQSEVASIRITPASSAVGMTVWFNATVIGGTGHYVATWSGLPAGCTGGGLDFPCRLSSVGTFLVSMVAVDGNGQIARSTVVSLSVSSSSGPGASPWFYIGIGGGVVVGLAAGSLWLFRSRPDEGARSAEAPEEMVA